MDLSLVLRFRGAFVALLPLNKPQAFGPAALVGSRSQSDVSVSLSRSY